MKNNKDNPDLLKTFESAGKSAFAFFGTPNNTTATLATSNEERKTSHQALSHQQQSDSQTFDIPKDELMALCMKLNKKMQSLESKNHDILRQKNRLTEDRHFLIDLMSHISNINIPNQPEAALDKVSVTNSLKKWSEDQQKLISALKGKISELESALLPTTTSNPFADFETQLHLQTASSTNSTETTAQPAAPMITNLSVSTTSNAFTEDTMHANSHDLLDLMDMPPAPAPTAQGGTPHTPLTDFSSIPIPNELEITRRQLQDTTSKLRKCEQDLERLQSTEAFLKSQNSTYESEIRTKSTRMEFLVRESEELKTKHEESLMYIQMQWNSFKAKAECAETELKNASEQIINLQAKITSQEVATKQAQGEIVSLQATIVSYEDEIQTQKANKLESDKMVQAVNVAKNELEMLVNSLKKDIKRVTELSETQSQKLVEAQSEISRLQQQVVHAQELSSSLATLKTQNEDNLSLITRLRQESMTNERNHAMKTAMLATAEVQIDNLKKEILSKENTTKEALDRVTSLQIKLSSTEARLEERVKELTEQIDDLNRQIESLKVQHDNTIVALKEQSELHLEGVQREHAKKSSTARMLVSEKEEEVRLLQDKVKELQAEIASGAPAERKIFELANLQARRDAAHGQHADNREVAFQQLQSALAGKDLELARLQQAQTEQAAELAEMRRVTKREGVNMDYLKNIVLQYMTFPVTSPERQQLVPVIAALLQLNPKEITEVDKSAKEPIWAASRPVIEIKRSLKQAAEMTPAKHTSSSMRDPKPNNSPRRS